jgi:hypothetical protein
MVDGITPTRHSDDESDFTGAEPILWHALPADDAAGRLAVDLRHGLTTEQIARRRRPETLARTGRPCSR